MTSSDGCRRYKRQAAAGQCHKGQDGRLWQARLEQAVKAAWRLACPPRFIRLELGNTSFSSFANCTSRVLGSREVVIRICGQPMHVKTFHLTISSGCRGTSIMSSLTPLDCTCTLLGCVQRSCPSESAYRCSTATE